MDEIGADASGLPLGHEALDGLHRAGPDKIDLEIGEMTAHGGDQPGHRAGGKRDIDAHRPGTRIDGSRALRLRRCRVDEGEQRETHAGAKDPAGH
jgi:hypothetical protein